MVPFDHQKEKMKKFTLVLMYLNPFANFSCRSRFIISCLLLIPLAAPAQHQLRVAYFGETITHYGFRVAYDKSVKDFQRTKSTGAIIRKNIMLGGSMAIFRHPHQQIGFIVTPEISFRRTGKRGGLLDLSFAPAFFRYFYEGTTYEHKDGGFQKIPLAGRNAFLPTISIGGGRDFSVKHKIPWMWYYRVNLMRQYPYNASSLTRLGLEAGVIRKL